MHTCSTSRKTRARASPRSPGSRASKASTHDDVTHASASRVEALLAREQLYPTGLPLEPPVAIPHADETHTLKDALVVVRLAEPLAFGAMGDSDAGALQVRLAVFIVAGNGMAQVEALERLLSILGDGARRERLEAGSAENARRSFEAMLEQLAALTTAPDKPPHPRKP